MADLPEGLMDRLKLIRLVAMDVDGTYTDGILYYNAAGEVTKGFDAHDGLALELLRMAGIHRGFITGRSDPATQARADYLGADFHMASIADKRSALLSLFPQFGIEAAQSMFIGDDLNDIGGFEAAGVRIAVANAAAEIKTRADYITTLPGGHGAIREVVDLIMAAKGIDPVALWKSKRSRIAGTQ